MCMSPPSRLVQHTIDLNYANRKRSTSLKWILVNIALLLVFAYDLCYKCPGYTSPLHYVELCCAAVLAANALQHGLRLARARPAPPPSAAPRRAPPRPAPADCTADADVSLSPRRVWRADASPPPSPPSPASPRVDRSSPDQFIADSNSLAAYLRGYSERLRPEPAASSWATSGGCGAGYYQLSAPAAAAGADDAPAAHSPHVWRRLHLDPQRLEQWNLNLRLWLHVTILQRLVREMEAADEALAAAGLEARLGGASVERLRAAAAAAPQSALQSLPALLAYLEPFADQRYVVQRIRELARGGCLSAYRWNGGGSDWDDSKPTDAELVMHLLATYLDAALPAAGCARPFSAAHVSRAPALPPRGPGALAVRCVAPRPPHYALVLGDETVEPARGRNNLLHTLLLFLAAAARSDPPALRRLHLGRAGLNMLWIIGR
ncbi:transmembrane protein 209 [Spodoptera frugiperda]|uniref:Transmembrane protein 209 n=1 Tax=Spodoptera frugiperda TaxID=7108 RepID=A0A9R0CZK8_SPOFR|nr:transmembrane protein 209 [Spodoptera frugiperda]